jgi:hypothetical protein
MSRSGDLAAQVKTLIERSGLQGDSRAVKVPEVYLNRWTGIVATSDSVIIDHVEKVVDIAGAIINAKLKQCLTLSLGK